MPKDEWFELTPVEKLRLNQNELGIKLSKDIGVDLSGVMIGKKA